MMCRLTKHPETSESPPPGMGLSQDALRRCREAAALDLGLKLSQRQVPDAVPADTPSGSPAQEADWNASLALWCVCFVSCYSRLM